MDASSNQDRAAQNAARRQSSDPNPSVDSKSARAAPAEPTLAKGRALHSPQLLPLSTEPHASSWRRRLLQLGTASGISTLLHVIVLLMLGLWVIQQNMLEPPRELMATVSQEREVPPYTLPPDFTPPQDPSDDSGHPGLPDVAGNDSPVPLSVDALPPARPDGNIDRVTVRIQGPMIGLGPSGTLPKIPDIYKPTDPTDEVIDIDRAMGRLTEEIVQKLETRKVLLVWCMDESESMQDDRQEIMARINQVYQELGLTGVAKGDALLTAVTSYGEHWTNHLPRPTSNVQEITEAISSIQDDPSGKEIMCPAITQTLATFQPFAKKANQQIMLVCLTDESGDPASNREYLESTIEAARASEATLYFIGREAIFGYPYARMRHLDRNTKTYYLAQIDRGPETPYPEQLQIDGFHRRGDALPSGFGPYEQLRLARETNGIFFMLPSPEVELVNRDTRKYHHDSMLTYVPDLSARQDYAAERDRSPMRALIWKIITDLNPYNPDIGHKVEMQTEFSNDPTHLVPAIQREVAEARNVIQYLHEAQQALESVQPERDRESSDRWRANFDLLHAQTIAYRVRLQEYVVYLEAFQQSPKPVLNKFGAARPSNRWHIKMLPRRLTGKDHQADVEKATALFKGVIVDHRDTPWAARAEFEMKRHYGVDFEEGYVATPHGPGGVKRNPL